MTHVSVLLPVYNGAAFVKNAVDSVLQQTVHDFELIIVDNASTDGTGEILKEYLHDPRVKVYRNEQTIFRLENFMKAASYASPDSPWLKYIGADDVLFPECLEEMLRVADSAPGIGLVSSQCYDGEKLLRGSVPEGEEAVSGAAFLRRLLLEKETRETVFSPASLMLSHQAFREMGGFRVNIYHSDTELFYLILNNYDLAFVHRPLSRSGQHAGSGVSQSVEQGIIFSEAYFILYHNLKRYTNLRLTRWEVERIKKELVTDSLGFILLKAARGRFRPAFSHLRVVPAAACHHFIPAAGYYLLLAVKKLFRRERIKLFSPENEA